MSVELRPTPLAPLRDRVFASSISPESAEVMARLGAGIMIFLQKPWEQTVGDLDRYAAHYRRYRGSEPAKPMVVIFNACRPHRRLGVRKLTNHVAAPNQERFARAVMPALTDCN